MAIPIGVARSAKHCATHHIYTELQGNGYAASITDDRVPHHYTVIERVEDQESLWWQLRTRLSRILRITQSSPGMYIGGMEKRWLKTWFGGSRVGVKERPHESSLKKPRRGGLQWWRARKRQRKLGSEVRHHQSLETREAWGKEDVSGPGKSQPQNRNEFNKKTQSTDKNSSNQMVRRKNLIKLRDQSTLEYVTWLEP
jgi:hypothetical protein